MNKLLKYFVGSVVLILLGSSCDSMLDVDSNSIAFPEENQLNASKDQIYSVVGILSQLDKLTTPYVLLGELRGDLMSITDNADADLKEIYNQTISEDNIYNVKSDYYSIINNCNYFIANADTSIREGVDKVLLQEYAAIKAFRAWTYMQLVQNYGSVTYIDQPLMMINDIEGDFPE
ncbi:MAG: RagB/SusD family nutrient uptake outer membrane protein [Bacteroidales bacterium]|jgi:hypothetical protein|nr:RagB/SusD family nutrient uptake outer membrane protein [Bacteroidales bacterium]